VHCFAGCEVHSSVRRGAFLRRPVSCSRSGRDHAKREGRPFPAADILRAIAFEALVVAVAGSAMLAGEPFNAFDRDRLSLAVSRIQAALEAGGLNDS